MIRKKSIFWQIYPPYLLILILALAGVVWYGSSTLKTFLMDRTVQELKERLHLLESQYLVHLSPLDIQAVDSLCKAQNQASATRLTVMLPSGRVIGDSQEEASRMDTHMDRPEVIGALVQGIGTSVRYSRTLDQPMVYVAIALKKDSQVLAVIRASVSTGDLQEAIQDVQVKLALGGIMIGILGAGLALLISRRITRPLSSIGQWAQEIAQGRFESRRPAVEPDEIRALSDSMNQMAMELKERVETITRQRNEMEAMLSSMMEGVVAVDRDERILRINEAACRMFRCTPRGVLGKSLPEGIRNSLLHDLVREASTRKEPLERDLLLLMGEGDRYVTGHATVLPNEAGGGEGVLLVLYDVTRMRRLEEMRRDFMANVSHELKTPITAIKGFVETLREGALANPEDAGRFLNIIDKHVLRLESLIEDILSLSQIERETEQQKIILTCGRLRDVLANAIQLCEGIAASKRIDIKLSCDEAIDVRMDVQLMEKALVNLLDNSIKYSDEGTGVRVEANQSQGEVVIRVTDQGCGIPKEHLPRVFERFYRVDKGRSRQIGGTGLGLAIVKHIAQAHGGRVSVESRVGQGSTFSISLPKV